MLPEFPLYNLTQQVLQMVHIVLPAYNEEEGIEVLLNRIERIGRSFGFDYRMIVVDDGSLDHTKLVVQSYMDVMQIDLITHPVNQGIRGVFSTGSTVRTQGLSKASLTIRPPRFRRFRQKERSPVPRTHCRGQT